MQYKYCTAVFFFSSVRYYKKPIHFFLLQFSCSFHICCNFLFLFIQIFEAVFRFFYIQILYQKATKAILCGGNINCCTVKAFLTKFFSVRQFFPFLNSRRIEKLGYDRTVVPFKYSL